MTHISLLPFLLAQTGSDSPPSGGETVEVMSIFDYIHHGGVLSYVLIGLSFVALALIVRNLLALRLTQIVPPEAVQELEKHLKTHDLSGALRYCMQTEDRSFLTNIFEQALERCAASPFGAIELRSAVEDAAQTEVDRLHSLNDGVGIIAAVGPMLGLLGTVIGMIGAFHTIGSLEGAARSSELARFMSMALVCTAEGLTVAIPCTVVFAMFRRRITNLVGEAGRIMESLICLVAPRADGHHRPTSRTVPSGPAVTQVR